MYCLSYAAVLHAYFTYAASQISILFDEVSELAYVDLSTAVFVILIVAIIKVLLIPSIRLSRSLHDAHDEFF